MFSGCLILFGTAQTIIIIVLLYCYLYIILQLAAVYYTLHNNWDLHNILLKLYAVYKFAQKQLIYIPNEKLICKILPKKNKITGDKHTLS